MATLTKLPWPVVLVVLLLLVAVWYFLLAPSGSTSGVSGASALQSVDMNASLGKGGESSGGGDKPGVMVDFYYGTMSGNAEGFAKGLAAEAKKFGLRGRAIDLDRFTPDWFESTDPVFDEVEPGSEGGPGSGAVAVFLVATYGDGDPTDTAQVFHSWLTEAEDGAFEGRKFAVFGLGSRLYEKFCAMGKYVDERCLELGGERICDIGIADEANDNEMDFAAWRERIWPALRKVAGLEGVVEDEGDVSKPELMWRLALSEPVEGADENDPLTSLSEERRAAFADSAAHTNRSFYVAKPARVLVTRELRQKPSRGLSTLHVEIDGEGMEYKTADNVAILPQNEPSVVEQVLKRLDADGEQWVEWEHTSARDDEVGAAHAPPFPSPCTQRAALSWYCDLTGIPTRASLRALAAYCEDEEEKTRLARLSSVAGRDEWQAWGRDARRTIVEVLEAFPSCSIPIGDFFQVCAPLAPREYTGASSARAQPKRIGIVFSIVDEPKPGAVESGGGGEGGAAGGGGAGERRHRGVCTNYLVRVSNPAKEAADKDHTPPAASPLRDFSTGKAIPVPKLASPTVRIVLHTSSFKLPESHALPLILVSAGTGIAPMRAFLEERRAAKEEGEDLGPCWFFFGCRKSDEDFVYESELERAKEEGVISRLVTAFSREGDEKVYVQHRLEEHGPEVWDMIHEDDGRVYVCGATSMGTEVRSVIVSLAGTKGGMGLPAAKDYVQKLEDDAKYVQELWS